ncbi:redoxin domain-containing protein [Schlesneria sp.]|uniref:redoxin domain-containing protein n=1 Tax=Schlesneria sp. TaxID=2762018 RepID=UPI002F047729
MSINAFVVFAVVALSNAESAGPSDALAPANVTAPGHSMHGEAFDEGPRRAATLLGTTGRVTFPISTTQPRVQQFFNQGIGQLHGFWYFEAERSFRQAAMLDPDCAMTYFGMALSNTNNSSRAKGFIAEAVKRKEKATDRERRYIDALDAWYKADAGDEKKKKDRARNYVHAIEEIIYRYPDDLEAKAMLGQALWQNKGDLEAASFFAIDAVLKEVLAENPYHPVHHYRVHLWDNDKATLAVNSAERCGLSAPGIAHMWHMSGHTFSELNRYFDAVWHQEASARTDHAYMMRDMIFPDRIHNFAHNNEWLVRNLQYIGRVHDAITLSRNTIELPQHPKYNNFPGGKSAHFGRMRLFQIYSQFELWDALIADAKTQKLPPTEDETEQIKYFRHLGRAYLRKDDVENGRIQLAILERRLQKLRHEADTAADEAVAKARFEGADAKAVEAKKKEAMQPTAERRRVLERAVDELHGLIMVAQAKYTAGLERLTKAHDVDEAYLADIEVLAGKTEAALKRLRDWVGKSKNQVRPLAALTQLLWRQGMKDEARQTFESLRAISGAIDLDLPPFARLLPIAQEFGFGTDWRQKLPVARNAAELPDLTTLGPSTWQPSAAPSWTLPDGEGQLHSLADFRGKPFIAIFYLGYGCLHCAEQLKAFAPKYKDFEAAGISMIAISSDNVVNLKKSQERYKSEGEMPFKLVSDGSLETFKNYHAFDDFEDAPLHATVLIDADGKIRWHDVGPDPFMNVDFLLAESKRLLYPTYIQMPHEPEAPPEPGPADALSPRNVFPSPTPPQKPEPERREVAAGG